MRTCSHCGASIEHRAKNAKLCGNRCAAAAYRARDPDAWREKARNCYWRHPEEYRRLALSRHHANPKDRSVYSGYVYSSRVVPTAKRILGLASRMNEKQRGRFADWLLKWSHTALQHHEVDHFVADWNSQGI